MKKIMCIFFAVMIVAGCGMTGYIPRIETVPDVTTNTVAVVENGQTNFVETFETNWRQVAVFAAEIPPEGSAKIEAIQKGAGVAATVLDVVTGILAVIGGSAAIAACPITRKLASVLRLIAVIDAVGMNVGKAKNKE